MQNLVIVNGEAFWNDYFADEFDVYHVRLQTSKWMFENDRLYVFDAGKRIRIDNIFWRIGAIQPYPLHQQVLELIRFSGAPCVNDATVMLNDLNRWTMLNILKTLELPVIPFTAVVGATISTQMTPHVPSVLKIGSYHAGYGKMHLGSLEQWQDMTDLVVATEGYFTVEPYIDYKRDIRCLAVGDQIWAMQRKGSRWKANTGIVETHVISAPDILYDYTHRLVNYLKSDIIAIDFLETADGKYIALESNSVPGLSGFPNVVIETIVETSKQKFSATTS